MKARNLIVFLLLSGLITAEGLPLTESNLFGKGWVLRKDMPVFCSPKLEGLKAGIYQREDRLRLAFYTEGEEGECSLSFNPMFFFVRGMPRLVAAGTGKSRPIDYVFENERIIFKVVARRSLQFIEFYVSSRKLRNLHKLSIQDKMKQARTLRRLQQQIFSWSELAEGQIIAQPSVRPIVCHAGYDVDGIKIAVVWTNNMKVDGEFELIDARHNVQHPAPQAVIYRGKLRFFGKHIWGGYNYIADFTDFRKEGLYFIRLKIKGIKELTDSFVFPIKKNLYLKLAEKAAHWYYYQRCGVEVAGFHKACHTKDTIIKKDGTRVDVTGGWHDAGDYGKWIGPGTASIIALSILYESFPSYFKEKPVPYPLEEAAWEGRYFCKTYWDGIFHPAFTPNLENVCEWLGAPEEEPPRVLTEEQALSHSIKPPGTGLTGASLALLARLLRPFDRALSEKSADIAMDVFRRDSRAELKDKNWRGYLRWQAGLLLLDLELYQLTGREEFRKDAERRAEAILAQQAREGYFFLDRAKKQKWGECDFHLLALYRFLSSFPSHRLSQRIRRAFRLWADYVMQFAHLSSFGVIGGKDSRGKLINYRYSTGGNRFIAGFAWGLATASLLFKDKRYLEAAERQLQWILGFNPADVSMMAGVGRGPGCYHHRYCFTEEKRDGVVPGGILNGIVRGNGGIVEIGDITKNYVIAQVPEDYPIIDTQVWGWTYAYVTNEYWALNNAWFILGAAQVQKALQQLR